MLTHQLNLGPPFAHRVFSAELPSPLARLGEPPSPTASRTLLADNVQRLVDNYNSQLAPFDDFCRERVTSQRNEAAVTDYLHSNPQAAQEDYIKWSSGLKQSLARGNRATFRSDGLVVGSYRPLSAQYTYFDATLNERTSQLPSMFPTPAHENLGFLVMAPREGAEFAALATALMPAKAILHPQRPQLAADVGAPSPAGNPGQPLASAERGTTAAVGGRRPARRSCGNAIRRNACRARRPGRRSWRRGTRSGSDWSAARRRGSPPRTCVSAARAAVRRGRFNRRVRASPRRRAARRVGPGVGR